MVQMGKGILWWGLSLGLWLMLGLWMGPAKVKEGAEEVAMATSD